MADDEPRRQESGCLLRAICQQFCQQGNGAEMFAPADPDSGAETTVSPFPAPTAGELEPLLDREALKAWLKVSEWWVLQYTRREEDPLPWIGTARVQRMLPSALLAWMERNHDST